MTKIVTLLPKFIHEYCPRCCLQEQLLGNEKVRNFLVPRELRDFACVQVRHSNP